MPVDRMRTIRDAFLREVSGFFSSSRKRIELAGRDGDAKPPPKPTPIPTHPQMRAGLDGKPSTLMMLPSMVDVLPDG